MFENITQSQIQNEANNIFEKENPDFVGEGAGKYNDWKDGFLCGMIWWKAVLIPDYDGPESDLQIAVRKEIEPFFSNKVLDAKSKNENQLEFSFNTKSENEFDLELAKLHKV